MVKTKKAAYLQPILKEHKVVFLRSLCAFSTDPLLGEGDDDNEFTIND